ncbi:hypothetical protein [Listeria fleischmannii]|uniref:Uncharacterized protein n=1 Tax=Listeria fleischmannii FSL S10-1203 TaxID=1265822 RepID=W7E2B7_9LIST|nr:hypothetical protein [Listeria fleischmannii]EUJ64753.1 hypothetical protein MCOL2_01035 [Listeria fleischmannii FSL S10-1203]
MIQKFVLIENGYITAWSDVEFEGFTPIQANEQHVNLLDCVQVVNGITVLDTQRQQEEINRANQPDERDAAILELSDLVAQLMEKVNGGDNK